jgi:hypothetical protein
MSSFYKKIFKILKVLQNEEHRNKKGTGLTRAFERKKRG